MAVCDSVAQTENFRQEVLLLSSKYRKISGMLRRLFLPE